MGRWLVSVLCREIMNFKNVVVLFVSWLTMGQRDDEELRLALFHCLALREHRWNHLVRTGFPNLEQLTIVSLPIDVVSLQGLALVRDHIALHSHVFPFRLNYHCDKLGNFEAIRVVPDVVLLHLGCPSDLE